MKPGNGLSALWTFTVAAKHLSFAAAARELDVTPAAVSNQIGAFEKRLGTRLFFRTSRTMRLTHAGEELLASTAVALRTIDEAIARASRGARDETFGVSCNGSFAAKWLIPRLPDFRRRHPKVNMRIDISDDLIDFSRDETDVAIRFGDGVYPGLQAYRLLSEDVFPICSPKLLQSGVPLRQPNDLSKHTLIHLDWHSEHAPWPDWRMWLLAAKADKVDPTLGLHFNQTVMALQAATDGQGVALGNTSLVGDDIAAGRLIKPFDLSLKVAPEFGYYLVTQRGRMERPLTKAFREWLLAAITPPGQVVGADANA